MSQYSSYYLYQKYESRNGEAAIPVFPAVYSIDGDGTQQRVMKLENDAECGYIAPVETIYRWVNIPITEDYVCDECSSSTTYIKWVTVDGAFVCDGTTKYTQTQKYISNDNVTWSATTEYGKGTVIEVNSTDCGYIPPVVTIYRWVDTTGYECSGTTKMNRQKMQYSTNSGETWTDVSPAEYQAGTTVIEVNSTDCGYIAPQYRWATYSGHTSCSGYNLYQLEVYQVSYNSGSSWGNVSPEQTRLGSLIEANSTDCGYEPPVTQYRYIDTTATTCVGVDKYYVSKQQYSNDNGATWYDVSPTVSGKGSLAQANSVDCGYIAPQYRWEQITGYTCSGYNKYHVEVYQVSLDSGSTWSNVSPEQTRLGTLIEANSTDCGYVEPMYQYVAYGNRYTCSGTTKLQITKQQVSYDNGSSWQDVIPIVSGIGSVIEYNSTDCGYSGNTKLLLTYNDSSTRTVSCNSSTTLTENEVSNGSINSAVTSAVIGDCVTTIGQGAFWAYYNFYTSLTSVTIPNSVTAIGSVAFDGCTELSNITIPNSVISIGESAFYNCFSLPSITIPSGVTVIEEDTFNYCSGATSLSIGENVTTIGQGAFMYCTSLPSITIPDTVTAIGASSFENCTGATSLSIGTGVTSIGNAAFGYCSGLTSITIPDNVTFIDTAAFMDCSGATSLSIGTGVTNIPYYAFYFCCSLTSITIPNTVTSIGETTFNHCSGATSLSIGTGVTSIGNAAFGFCSSLTSITIPDNVTTIGEYAFTDCSGATSLSIGTGVTSIKSNTFEYCRHLTSITIPDNVTSIGQESFRYCSRLTSITVLATTPPTLGSRAFNYTNNAPIYVPASSLNAYKSASGWSSYSSRIQAI